MKEVDRNWQSTWVWIGQALKGTFHDVPVGGEVPGCIPYLLGDGLGPLGA